MRRRIYAICPDLPAAQQTMRDLLLARIDERHIHVLAKRGAPMEGLHEANILQKTDLVHGAELGSIVGGTCGLIVGAIFVLVQIGGVYLHLGAVLLIFVLGGALFGTWASSLIAASVPNTRLLAFAKDIEDGKYLMMADVPLRRVKEIQSLVHKRHPENERGGEPNVPAFP